VLWLDTFTSSFSPAVVAAAAAVLAALGYTVEPAGHRLCCGLTWVSTGQLDVARRVMRRTMAALQRSDGPVVVLEPSCAAALRDDSVKLLGSDAVRGVASRVHTLAEVVGDDLPPAASGSAAAPGGRVIAQFHCHQRAVLGTVPDEALLGKLGYHVTSVQEGCCGLAGNFGFEAGHFDVSASCAEESFLPYLAADPQAVVLADGFSCRLQMEQLGAEALAGRRPLHLAELLARHLPAP
jgi:Fe-S oxidoreductase